MSKKIIVHGPMQASNQIFPENKVPIYPIYIEKDSSAFLDCMEPLHLEKTKVLILTDSNIAKHHLDTYQTLLEKKAAQVHTMILPAGEQYKNLDSIQKIYETLIQNQFDRNDIIFALGGGVIGDMTGYAAATYLRGIRFVQLPTSLLSMVDSSIGGKTGVDFRAYKNMVGAFHQPQAVYINLSVLNTLPDREFYSGFGEIIKHGYIKDTAYLTVLKQNRQDALSRNLSTLEDIINTSCQIKQHVVENDPTEKGERALLNFGHTIGHAIEKYMDFKLLHGECVALGMVAATYISMKRGNLSEEEFKESISLINDYQLPVTLTLDKAADYQELLSIIRHDKKMAAGKIRFVLLNKPGEAAIYKNVSDEEIIEALSYVLGGK